MTKIKLIELNYLTTLRFSGEGALELLQGQLTCDMEKVSEQNSCLGALCNIKGRVISSFLVTSGKKSGFNLIGPKETIIKTHETLKKYLPFYKVKGEQDSSYNFYAIEKKGFKKFCGISMPDYKNTLVYDNVRFISYLKKEFLLAIKQAKDKSEFLKDSKTQNSIYEWYLDELYALNIEVTEELSGLYTPHELSYDKTSRIDFNKGCYTGQEIVARMHYRAKNLPKIMLAECNDIDLRVNMTICDKKDKKVGNIVKIVNKSDKSICVLSLKTKELTQEFQVKGTSSTLIPIQ